MKPQDAAIKRRLNALMPMMNEKQRRHVAAHEAEAYGYGGISAISRMTGMSRRVIRRGIREIENGDLATSHSIRKAGGGRKEKKDVYPDLVSAIEKLVDANTIGKPDSAIKWTNLSCKKISEALQKQGMKVSQSTVHRIMKQDLKFRLKIQQPHKNCKP